MKPGQRVELHPVCDEWMQGDKYGVVVGFGKPWRNGVVPVRVRLDVSGRIKRFHPDNLAVSS